MIFEFNLVYLKQQIKLNKHNKHNNQMEQSDKKIQSLIKKIAAKREEIGDAKKPRWKINSMFKWGTTSPVKVLDVRTNTDTNVFISALAFLIKREQSHVAACEMLELTVEFDWYGYSLEQWVSEFKTRIAELDFITKKEELDILESKLDKLMSPELKKQMQLDEITLQLS